MPTRKFITEAPVLVEETPPESHDTQGSDKILTNPTTLGSNQRWLIFFSDTIFLTYGTSTDSRTLESVIPLEYVWLGSKAADGNGTELIAIETKLMAITYRIRT